MQSKKLGRAAAAAGLLVMLAPGVAVASWWDGGYDGRYDHGHSRYEERPPPPPGPVGPIYGCENSDLAGPGLALHKETTPPPGTPVAPGDEILVDITWRVSDWSAPFLHKVLDCVYIDGLFVPEMSIGEHDTPNDGHFGISYIVPFDAPIGGEICDQGFVSGPNGWEDYYREVSNVVCFPICPPVDQPPPPPGPPPPPPPPLPSSSAAAAAAAAEEPTTTTSTTVPEEEPYYGVGSLRAGNATTRPGTAAGAPHRGSSGAAPDGERTRDGPARRRRVGPAHADPPPEAPGVAAGRRALGWPTCPASSSSTRMRVRSCRPTS